MSSAREQLYNIWSYMCTCSMGANKGVGVCIKAAITRRAVNYRIINTPYSLDNMTVHRFRMTCIRYARHVRVGMCVSVGKCRYPVSTQSTITCHRYRNIPSAGVDLHNLPSTCRQSKQLQVHEDVHCVRGSEQA
jgi:hypothetical protein